MYFEKNKLYVDMNSIEAIREIPRKDQNSTYRIFMKSGNSMEVWDLTEKEHDMIYKLMHGVWK